MCIRDRLYQTLTGHQIPKGTDGNYSQLVEIFNALQAAGPDLTPANMARGIHAPVSYTHLDVYKRQTTTRVAST